MNQAPNYPSQMKLRVDKFFVGVYALVSLVFALQLGIIVWGALYW